MATLTSRLTGGDFSRFEMPTVIADPAPLGLAAFALTTFVLSAVNAGWVPKSGETAVLGLAAAYGGAAQFAAGMWEFRRNNTFGATAFSSYGAFWMAFALLVTLYLPKISPAALPSAIGTFLLAWTIFTLYMTFAARHVSRPVFAVFVFLSATFFALTVGAYAGLPGATVIGGYLGIATAAAAWYASFRGVMSATAPAKGAN
jgi:succinate-acetate transporter protein